MAGLLSGGPQRQPAWGEQEDVPLRCLALVKATGTLTRHVDFVGQLNFEQEFLSHKLSESCSYPSLLQSLLQLWPVLYPHF